MTPQFNLIGNRREFRYLAYDRAQECDFYKLFGKWIFTLRVMGNARSILFLRKVGGRRVVEN